MFGFYPRIIALFLTFNFSISSSTALNPQESPYQLIVFQGSDWCVPCIKLEKNILSDSLFLKYLIEHDIELKLVDFPQRKKQDVETKKENMAIAERYQFNGLFPTILLQNEVKNKWEKLAYNNQQISDFLLILEDKIAYLK